MKSQTSYAKKPITKGYRLLSFIRYLGEVKTVERDQWVPRAGEGRGLAAKEQEGTHGGEGNGLTVGSSCMTLSKLIELDP